MTLSIRLLRFGSELNPNPGLRMDEKFEPMTHDASRPSHAQEVHPPGDVTGYQLSWIAHKRLGASLHILATLGDSN